MVYYGGIEALAREFGPESDKEMILFLKKKIHTGEKTKHFAYLKLLDDLIRVDWALSAFFGQLERQGRRQKSFSLVLVNLENDSFYCVVGLMDSTDVVLLSDRGLKEVGDRGRRRRVRRKEETKVEYRQLQEFLDIRSVYHS